MKSLVTSMSSPLVESSLCKIQQRHTYFTLKIIFSGQWEPYSKKGNILFALWLCSKNKRKMARETTGWPYKQRVPALKSKSCILQTWIFTQCSLYSWQAWRQRDSDLIKHFLFQCWQLNPGPCICWARALYHWAIPRQDQDCIGQKRCSSPRCLPLHCLL